ncbi:hypothetical protein [Paraburkholderia megapolitana]|uniref:hypothetical protein n=1 Tax=Paraburkholderia megapolitana TaxID=420953 RepID=UPI0038B83CD8
MSGVESSEIHLTRDAQPITVTRYNGVLAVRTAEPALALAGRMLEEIWQLGFVRDGVALKPCEVRPVHWSLLFSLLDLSGRPYLMLSNEQFEVEVERARAEGDRFDLCDVFDTLAHNRFGFGIGGPCVQPGEPCNSRHEVHVAYALLLDAVPAIVMDDYRTLKDPFRHGLAWAQSLLDVPSLRGRISREALSRLRAVMKSDGKAITERNAVVLCELIRQSPEEPSVGTLDDLLAAHGIVDQKLPLPARYSQPVDIGAPASPLALRMRELLANSHRDQAIARIESERAAGRLAMREYRLRHELALLDHGRATYEWGNRFVHAIDGRDLRFLLQNLDTTDDWNRSTKRAIFEVLGVKLTGLRAAARRRAVFALCGLDEAAQAEWEAQAQVQRAAREHRRLFDKACELAERARYRAPDSTVISGVQHVDTSIAAGFSEIREWRKGAAKQYALVNPEKAEGRRLQAKDGTLAYARAMLEKIAA